ncbi:MAG: ELWxxDGT repeat protein [Thermoanaerobaculia bacterium]
MRKRILSGVAAVSILLAAGAASAADPVPYLVADLSKTRRPVSSYPNHLTVAGGYAYFIARVRGFGSQLWRTDGTPGGSLPLTSMPEFSWSETTPAALGPILIFANGTEARGQELWKSDGSVEGTVLVSDICPGACSSTPTGFTEYGGAIFFAADDGVHGVELWRTDGTAAGTWLVSDAGAGYLSLSPALIAAGPGGVLFAGSQGLWKSTGARGSVTKVSSTTPKTALVAHGGLVFFTADDTASGRELWKSDGTEAGTSLVRDINPSGSSSPSSLVSSPAGLLFAATDGTSGTELWKSDGTAAGTVLIKDISPPGSSSPAYLTAIGTTVYFAANDGTSGVELWSTDGTPGGTARIADLKPGSTSGHPRGLAKVGSSLFFGDGGGRLWICNGAAASMVKGFGSMNGVSLITGSEHAFVDLHGTAIFAASDGPHGSEPWASNGTPAGTVMLADAEPGGVSANPRDLVQSGSSLFFIANDDALDAALWKTDGTAAGTRALRRIDTLASASNLVDLKGTLFFSVRPSFSGGALWKSDGTESGTVIVKALESASGEDLKLTPAGGALFFPWSSPANGTELWRSDGTGPGTALLRDLEPGSASGDPRELTPWGSTLLFTAKRVDSGTELWKSDGTEAGTTILADVIPGTAGSYPSNLVAAGSRFYFRAIAADGYLWSSDGAQTRGLKLRKGSGVPVELAAFGSRLVFGVSDGLTGIEPWMWDGTSASAAMLKDIKPGAGDSGPSAFAYAGGVLLFAADDGVHGMELWKSDGTAAGTMLLRDIAPGPASSLSSPFPSTSPTFSIFVANDTFFFAADDGVHGRELWTSDGTTAGTRLVGDINPGPGASDPSEFTVCKGKLYFTAYAQEVGEELFALHLLPAPFSSAPKRRSAGRP